MQNSDPAYIKRPTRRLTDKGAATRERILAATVERIVESGFAAMTIESVMAKAGLSRGSVLHQFPTRLDLAIATAQRTMRAVMDAARERANAIDDPFERLAGYAQIVWDTHSTPEGLALTDILNAARWDTELLAAIQPVAAQVEAEIAEELRALATAGGLAEPEAMVARGWLLVSSARGLIIEHRLGSNRHVINAAIEEMKLSHRRYCEAHSKISQT
ncbi:MULTISPECIES: TetR/AcrR family transcriptional regulator [Sphingomonas]|jgi:AcrR family transcriptional regulator|uniref:TetR/AcrR family transcriptional regulator n=1 Tax=Sphingomonas TaxID=13687 RepID=UPI00082ECE08|nr:MULTISPECIES: TetR/AcrR family transcriptional regulator [Sphingomonas]MBY0300797.1 TetR/AcrR family transcriptional regulator [Sphingomonas ginsenosidimutans]